MTCVVYISNGLERNNDKRRKGNDPRNEKSYYYSYGTNDTGGLGEGGELEILSIFSKTEDRYNHGNLLDRQRQRREEKQLWARARCGNIGRGHEGRGGHPCRGCKVEKERAEHIENCEEFGN